MAGLDWRAGAARVAVVADETGCSGEVAAAVDGGDVAGVGVDMVETM